MALSRTVPLGAHAVTVRELTVTDVRDRLLSEESGAAVDPLRALVFDGFGLDDIAGMCDVSAEVLEGFPPSELAELVAACQAVNPFFFRVKTLLVEAGRRLQLELQAPISPAPRAPWLSAVIRVCGRIRGVFSS